MARPAMALLSGAILLSTGLKALRLSARRIRCNQQVVQVKLDEMVYDRLHCLLESWVLVRATINEDIKE